MEGTPPPLTPTLHHYAMPPGLGRKGKEGEGIIGKEGGKRRRVAKEQVVERKKGDRGWRETEDGGRQRMEGDRG